MIAALRRRLYADLGHVWAEAACSIGLGLMRLLPKGWR